MTNFHMICLIASLLFFTVSYNVIALRRYRNPTPTMRKLFRGYLDTVFSAVAALALFGMYFLDLRHPVTSLVAFLMAAHSENYALAAVSINALPNLVYHHFAVDRMHYTN